MEKLLINTIYPATEGEGVRVGSVQVFVRFQGCAVRCVNCDSKDTWGFDESRAREQVDVLAAVKKLGHEGKIKTVSITGGDPLNPRHRKGLLELIIALKREGYFLNIEVTGHEFVPEIFSLVDFISMDLKTPSCQKPGVIGPLLETAKLFSSKLQLKSVIQTRNDFDFTLKAYQEMQSILGTITFPWVLTPAFNVDEEKPLERIDQVFHWNEELGGPFRVIIQQHKLIYGTKRKDV